VSNFRLPHALVWFRRDLRLADNPALTQALAAARSVTCVFVWDPRLAVPAGPARRWFLEECLRELGQSLDGRLVVRQGLPEQVIPELARLLQAPEVYVSSDFGPYGRGRDALVANVLEAAGRRLVKVGSPYAVDPGSLTTNAGTPLQVFTPFYRAWRDKGWPLPLPVPSALERVSREGLEDDPGLPATQPPSSSFASVWPPGEREAWRRLDAFLAGPIETYASSRDRADLDCTSRLSPYLRFGVLHPRQILARLDPSRRSHQRFESELCWREFYADVLFHRPDSAREPYRAAWRSFACDSGPEADRLFAAWCEGRTGYPIVDAGMRQLLGEGWVHNRVRMIVASFLVKDLHLPWQRGARWFMRHLVDADLASNQHGWQWVAGSGTDAAPYFRIFNPVTQAMKFDPEGDYVRRWVPELTGLGSPQVHEPWKLAKGTAQLNLGGSDLSAYPLPVVDHSVERQVALERYARLRAADGA